MYCFRENSNFPFSNQKIITLVTPSRLVFISSMYFWKFIRLDIMFSTVPVLDPCYFWKRGIYKHIIQFLAAWPELSCELLLLFGVHHLYTSTFQSYHLLLMWRLEPNFTGKIFRRSASKIPLFLYDSYIILMNQTQQIILKVVFP